jgi:hypothetical protein
LEQGVNLVKTLILIDRFACIESIVIGLKEVPTI